ncbi:MAG: VOC family protein [Paenarthrobacter ureafaciens]|uniref:VOC family protein n=1 Tax=Paenarthrobacter ureafaciens TaxID=37931 RepID=UPI001ACC9945|nr:VOC family protein [Paenarthrobacter ureafaciens]MBN9130569.1 VOC family protein [Paenarthrobacter ureafaciens]
MTTQTLYLWFPGNATEALKFYHETFGGELTLHTFEEFGRTDGPPSAIAHGELSGPVSLYATDTADGEEAVSMTGVSIALLGTADGPTLTQWFNTIAQGGGSVLDPLQKRSWGAYDGQVVDRFGVRWLIGYEATDSNKVDTGPGTLASDPGEPTVDTMEAHNS